MAVWQFDVSIASSSSERALSPTQTHFAEIALSALLGPPQAMFEDWLFFGDKNGSRVDLVRIDGGGCELSARIDAREEADKFITVVVAVADSMNCSFFDDNGAAIAASHDELRKAVMASAAWRYALDPNLFCQRPDADDAVRRTS